MFSFFLQGTRRAVLIRAICTVAVISTVDWRVEGNISLGFLYLFPMLLAGSVLSRTQLERREDQDVDHQPGHLHIQRQLDMQLLMLDVKYYGALRNFFQTVRTADEQQIVLQPGSAAAKN